MFYLLHPATDLETTEIRGFATCVHHGEEIEILSPF